MQKPICLHVSDGAIHRLPLTPLHAPILLCAKHIVRWQTCGALRLVRVRVCGGGGV